ncbi:MAG TPA: MBL fold metallo-hydrolase [Methanocorpusculum sp.]|nr:MBL fold metallo-hydrolase [Methanocorpusculum sp.]
MTQQNLNGERKGVMKYITPSYKKKILPYLTTLSKEKLEQYFRDTEETIQELVTRLGKRPKEVKWIVQSIGLYLYGNKGRNFYADCQKIQLSKEITLWTLQPPGGGCLHIFQTPKGKLMIDAGYGVNYDDWVMTLVRLGLGSFDDVKMLLITHGDADHVGMAGFMPCPAYMHPVTKELLQSGSRGFAAVNNFKKLVRTYTLNINTISQINIPEDIILAKTVPLFSRGAFPVIDTIDFAGLHFEVIESRGGHLAGQLFYYEPKFGLLFTSDAILNMASLSRPRLIFGAIPDYLITSVNINSRLATEERTDLFALAKELDAELKKSGRFIRLVCGHGAVSTFDAEGKLAVTDPVVHIANRRRGTEKLHGLFTAVRWGILRKTV